MSTEALDTQPAPPAVAHMNEHPDARTTDDGSQSGNLEKIRDILFGQQARDHERRFLALEQSLVKEAGALRAELTKRFDALEAYMQQEVAVLSDRLRLEQHTREEARQQLGKDLASLGTVLERTASELSHQTNQAEQSLRQETLVHINELRDALHTTHTQLTDALNRSVEDLRHAKTDRTALAELLAELSQKLRGGSQPS